MRWSIRIIFFSVSCVIFLQLCTVHLTRAARRAGYADIVYQNQEVLKEFNHNLYLGRNLSREISRKNIVTVEDEVYAKVDFIVAKVETVLDMFPEGIHFRLVILRDRGEVAKAYRQSFNKKVNYKAYYSLPQKTIYISAEDTSLRVLSHEIAHMVVDHFFEVRPPYNIHELMAQFAEKHVAD